MSNQWEETKKIAKKVKDNNPNTLVVVGGVYATVEPKKTLQDENIDIAVIGEGEKAMFKIVSEEKTEGVVFGESVRNLDDLPLPARHLINMNWYLKRDRIVISEWCRATHLLTSRGCSHECIYCINSKHVMFSRKVRFHSAEYVEKEVSQLVDDYNIEGMCFYDDNFLLDKKRLLDICNKIKPFNLKWMCQSRVDTVTKDILKAMKRSGCVIVSIGVESGSQKVLNVLQKRARIEDTIKAFDLCRELGIKTSASIMIGCPEENMGDILLTDRLLNKIKPDFTQIWYATPYHGTVLYDMAQENGWIKSSDLAGEEPQITPQMEINFTLEELKFIRKDLMRKYGSLNKTVRSYLKNPYFIYDMLRLILKNPFLLRNDVEIQGWRRFL